MSASAQSRDPPEYDYGRIPFGVTAREVLQELIGTTVESDHVGKAQFIGQYQMLPDFFTEGLYPNLLGVKQLNAAITRMYRVSHESWANVAAMELYFFCDQEVSEDPASCRLFLIRKTLKTAGTDSYLTVSRSLEETITDSLRLEPVSHDVKYQPLGQLLAIAARISLWKGPVTDIFVLVYQNILSSINADIIYRDHSLWLKYVMKARAENSAEKNRSHERIRAVRSSF